MSSSGKVLTQWNPAGGISTNSTVTAFRRKLWRPGKTPSEKEAAK
jgi:hypothetical protein